MKLLQTREMQCDYIKFMDFIINLEVSEKCNGIELKKTMLGSGDLVCSEVIRKKLKTGN